MPHLYLPAPLVAPTRKKALSAMTARYVFPDGSIFTGFDEAPSGLLVGEIRWEAGELRHVIKIHRNVLMAMNREALLGFMENELNIAFAVSPSKEGKSAA